MRWITKNWVFSKVDNDSKWKLQVFYVYLYPLFNFEHISVSFSSHVFCTSFDIEVDWFIFREGCRASCTFLPKAYT